MIVDSYAVKEVIIVSSLVAAEQTVEISGKTFMISNTGAQPAYFKEKAVDAVAATASNAMLIPANTVFPTQINARTLSVISNSTGTTLAILILDL